MKKIGVLTIINTGNYGASLQAMALIKVINEKRFGNAELINYCSDAIKNKIDYKYVKKVGIKKTIAAIVDKICYFPRMKKMSCFNQSLIHGPELKREELRELNEKYDVFLSGSDQVWNPFLQQGDNSYLLDFVQDDKKKRSYGSSFGVKSLPVDCREDYYKLLSKFEIITVRETSGVEIVEELIGKKPEIVLDPVFLIEPEQWEKMLPASKNNKNNIFVYRMTYSRKLTQIAAFLSSQTGYSLVASPFLIGYAKHNSNQMSFSSLEWLRAIYDSDFVITDSFHGIAFSLIFSKQFYYVITSDSVKSRISRVETLLESLGIKDRIIENISDIKIENRIDYDKIQTVLQQKRIESIQILEKILL